MRLLCRTACACFSLSLKPITPSTEKNQINLTLLLDNDSRMQAEFQGSYPSSPGTMHAEGNRAGMVGDLRGWIRSCRAAEEKKKTIVENKIFFFFLMKEKSFQEVEMRTGGLGGLQRNPLARGIAAK